MYKLFNNSAKVDFFLICQKARLKVYNFLLHREDSILVLFSNSSFSDTLAKFVFFELQQFFNFEEIYSASKLEKPRVFAKMKENFPNSTFMVFGGKEENELACKKVRYCNILVKK